MFNLSDELQAIKDILVINGFSFFEHYDFSQDNVNRFECQQDGVILIVDERQGKIKISLTIIGLHSSGDDTMYEWDFNSLEEFETNLIFTIIGIIKAKENNLAAYFRMLELKNKTIWN